MTAERRFARAPLAVSRPHRHRIPADDRQKWPSPFTYDLARSAPHFESAAITSSPRRTFVRARFDFKICITPAAVITPTVFEFRSATPPLLRHDYHSVPHRHLGVHVPADLHGWPTNALGHRQRGRRVLCQGLRLGPRGASPFLLVHLPPLHIAMYRLK